MSDDPSLWLNEKKARALFELKEFKSARLLFEESLKIIGDEATIRQDYMFHIASCLASEGQFKEALKYYMLDGGRIAEQDNYLLYNKALCNYKLKNYNESFDLLDQLFTNCEKNYPEFSIKTTDDGGDPLKSLDYALDPESFEKLQDSCIIESLNLKAAILFKLNAGDALVSKRCLDEVPIKSVNQLDYVTLHNQAIYEHVIDPAQSLNKLSHLSDLVIKSGNLQDDKQQLGFAKLVPKDTFRNLIIICMFTGQLDAAIAFMRQNRSHIERNITSEIVQFIEIQLERLTGSDDSLVFRRFNKLLDKVVEQIKRIDSKGNNYTGDLDEDELLSFAMTVLTHQCSILWHNNQYQALERLLMKMEAQFGDDLMWKKSLAHTLYMLDTRFEDCALLYEELLPKSTTESLLSVEPLVLGNLCVAYVLTGRNREAEVLIKDVESDDARFAETHDLNVNSFKTLTPRAASSNQQTARGPLHLTVINLVIGTLYCVKNNYEFGLTRLIKTLEPIEQKLSTQTWFHVKRCILAMLDCHCKQMNYIKDNLFDQLVSFLIQCERHGVLIETTTTLDVPVNASRGDPISEQELRLFHGRNSVTFEARQLRAIVLTMIHD